MVPSKRRRIVAAAATFLLTMACMVAAMLLLDRPVPRLSRDTGNVAAVVVFAAEDGQQLACRLALDARFDRAYRRVYRIPGPIGVRGATKRVAEFKKALASAIDTYRAVDIYVLDGRSRLDPCQLLDSCRDELRRLRFVYAAGVVTMEEAAAWKSAGATSVVGCIDPYRGTRFADSAASSVLFLRRWLAGAVLEDALAISQLVAEEHPILRRGEGTGGDALVGPTFWSLLTNVR